MIFNPMPLIIAFPVWYFFGLKGVAIWCIIIVVVGLLDELKVI